jgi:hypothetical protein
MMEGIKRGIVGEDLAINVQHKGRWNGMMAKESEDKERKGRRILEMMPSLNWPRTNLPERKGEMNTIKGGKKGEDRVCAR